ncbi:MAG: endonuclease/exonuclease/phosphatase family protein [Gammaproteobacteria bacterium]|nr:endonuclease/exonuclease/phosphatase family protein [Gammaproteobacteria bacterium]
MTSRFLRLLPLLLAVAALAACVRVNVYGDPDHAQAAMPDTLRVATYNVSLYSEEAGGLARRLEAGDDGARRVAAVLQRVRPDIVLVNEFDYVADGSAADLFQQRYLETAQPGGGRPLRYPYRYLAPVNTGVPSGLDLDRDGNVGGEGRARGNDAWGYGLHPGQYGMLVLSRHPIDAQAVRTFQLFKWKDLPGARRPMDPETGAPWYPDAVWEQLRLSSKSHWDVPVRTPAGTVHLLASHPTPPVFDGPERRNRARNADEIRFWQEYISGGELAWLCDDAGRCGGLRDGARFVIAGDLNNDPHDGDGVSEAIAGLLEHPRLLRHPAPRSPGAVHAALDAGGANLAHAGPHAHDTSDFGPQSGNLRVDYVLPSTGFEYLGGRVYWPAPDDPSAPIVEGSDHRLVWADLRIP